MRVNDINFILILICSQTLKLRMYSLPLYFFKASLAKESFPKMEKKFIFSKRYRLQIFFRHQGLLSVFHVGDKQMNRLRLENISKSIRSKP